MSDTDSIPDTFLNKSQISVKYGMSRVTINKHLKALEASGRLIPTIVKQGNRKLYKYDPADLDVAFASLNSTSKNNKNVQSIVFNDQNVKLQTENELLKINIQNAEKRLLEKDEQISDLKDQRDLKDRQIEVLQSLVTDQRPKSASIATEPTKEEVVPPVKPTSETDYTDPYQPDTTLIEEQKRIYFEKTGKDIPPIKTQKDYDEFRKIVGSDDEILFGNDGDLWLSKAKDAEPEAQPELPPIEDKQPTEAPKEKEARRDNIAPKAQPQQYEKPKGLWAWLKGY